MKTERQKLIKKCDDLVREIVRLRDKWTCQRSGFRGDKHTLQVAHYFSRDYKRIRWDEDNLCLLRNGLHLYWAHKYPEEFRDFWINRIGKDKFNILKLKSQVKGTIYTYELKVLQMELQKRLKELKEGK